MIFHSTEFQFVLAVGNRAKRIVQLSWLSLCINLRKEQIDHSKGQKAYLFVNGRKEDVKFSRIKLLCKFVWDHTQFAILMNADHKHRTVESVCFVNELDLDLRITEHSTSSVTNFRLKKNNSVATV